MQGRVITSGGSKKRSRVEVTPLHPTPYTLRPTPYALHPTPYTLHPTPCTLHPAPYTLQPTPYTLHPTPHTPHPKPFTLKQVSWQHEEITAEVDAPGSGQQPGLTRWVIGTPPGCRV